MNRILAINTGIIIFLCFQIVPVPVLMMSHEIDGEPTIIIDEKFLYYDGINITWHGVAAFKLKTSNLVIYLDPYLLESNIETADIVIATHEHFDHLSIPDLRKIADITTTVYTPRPGQVYDLGTTVEELESVEVKEIHYTKPWDIIEEFGITLEFVPAYNANHFPEFNWTGVVVDFGNVRIYHAGDTAHIPEMKQINCNIALLPIMGNGLMTDEEGAEVVESLQVSSYLKYAIPMHYSYPVKFGDTILGDLDEVEAFKEKAKCTVIILEPMNLYSENESTTTTGKTTPGFSIIIIISFLLLGIFTRRQRSRE
ncbi:MAG: MBL fold metallo-hydrolase [Candidatus Hermodarchaeota archaeon]